MDQPEDRSVDFKAAGLSFSIHIVLLALVLFLFSRTARSTTSEPDRTGEIVLAVRNEAHETEYLKESDASTDQSVPSQPDFSNEPPPAFDLEVPTNDAFPGTVPIDIVNDANTMTQDTIGTGKSQPYELTKEDLEMIAADQKLIQSRQPKGPATTINVFGTGGLTGRKFVFLMDRSKSMGEQGLGVLKQARTELANAINGLKPHHEFQIVVYHNSTATISKRQLLTAEQQNKNLVPGFLNNLVAFGGTNHQNGLYAALAFQPDVVVMMTDGGSPELHAGHLEALTRAAGRTQIHTIQFGSGPQPHDRHFLMNLAGMNSGTYRYVDVRQWLK